MIQDTKYKLSVAIATFNEEENIGRCLESVKNLADEVVVVDGSSKDKTVQIAKKSGARVIVTTNKPMFHTNKNIAINSCRGEWILQLDADEIVPPGLAKEIKLTIGQQLSATDQQPVAYWLKRKNYFLGRFLKKGGQYPDPVIRLFKKGKARLPEESVHEQMKVEGEVGWLKNDLIHWATPKFSRYWLRENRYSTLEAEEFHKKKTPVTLLTSMIYIIIVPIKTFLSIFIRHKGFLDGWQGFVFAFFSGFHYSWAFFKFLKMRIKKDFEIEKNWK
jgi:glycosyltransferase involved in cell wall biosynthesis